MHFCPHCDGPFYKRKHIAVVGGGNSGLEAAIDVAGIVGYVTVVEFTDSLIVDDVLQSKLRSLPNVEVVVSAQTAEITGDRKMVDGLVYLDGRPARSTVSISTACSSRSGCCPTPIGSRAALSCPTGTRSSSMSADARRSPACSPPAEQTAVAV